jgi:ABC-type antimicrobial peptide transport system permease subunit
MKHIAPVMRYVALAILALLGIALGGVAGAIIGVALAYILIAPVAMIAATIFSSPHVDPMSIGFPVMENCATMGFAAGGVIATFLISCRYRTMPESPL